MTNQTIEQAVEEIVSTVETVEFLHGVPVNLPNEYKADLRGVARKALQAQREAGAREERDKILQLMYAVDVEKVPTIAEEAWANQYSNKPEAFWHGQAQYRKELKEALTPPTK